MSPSSTSAIGPPTAASGDTCPIEAPLDAPENRPSVISATEDPSPIPAIAEVGFSISLMPAGKPTRKGGAKVTKEQLGTLILDSERQMYSTAKSMLYSDQDCADAIQETIVKAFSGVHTLRNDKYAKTWLMRILINECYTILRKTSKVISLDEMCETTELAADEKSDYSDLYKAVGSLKEDLRMPVILYYIENFNIREIAQIMDISEGAVQKRLARARGKLRQDLQESEAWT